MSAQHLHDFNFYIPMPLRWSDHDELGHVNNANYLTYLEEARIEYFTLQCGWDWERDGLILANVNIDYLAPLVYTDDCRVYVRTVELGTKSFTLEYLVVAHGEKPIIKSRATTVMVAFDYATQKSKALNPEVKQRMLDLDQPRLKH